MIVVTRAVANIFILVYTVLFSSVFLAHSIAGLIIIGLGIAAFLHLF